MMKRLLCVLLVTAFSACPVMAKKSLKTPLQRQIDSLAVAHPNWKIGVAVWQIHQQAAQSRAQWQGDNPLALASVFKVPVLVEIARQIDSKQGLQLSTGLTVSEAEKCIGSGRLRHEPAGTVVRVDRLIELMETISDNTATDMLFRHIGLASVNKMLVALGCQHSDISLTNRAAWLISLGQSSVFRGLGPAQIAQKWEKLSREERAAAVVHTERENERLSLVRFQQLEDQSDRQQTYEQNVLVATTVDNKSSANDLALVLSQLYLGKAMSSTMTQFCLGVLSRQHFNTRIPRELPAGTKVYHKTGTIAGVVNDIGIIEGPNGDAAVVVVLVNGIGSGEDHDAEVLIGRVAKAAYDGLLK